MPTFDTPEPITAEIDVYVGEVRIHAGDRADTVVQVRPSDPSAQACAQAAERTTVEFSGGRLLVTGPRPRTLGYLRSWRGSIEVTVELPTGSAVEAEVAAGGMAHVVATGVLGRTVLRSSNGDLRVAEAGPLEARTSIGAIFVDRVRGPAEVAASTGTIRIGSIDGPGTVKSSTGDISVGEATGELRLKNGVGGVCVDRVLGDVTVTTAHGRIRVGEAAGGTIHLESGSGKVGVGVADGTAAWLDLHAKNGVVRSTLDAADGPGAEDAAVEVHAHTNYGDIDVHRCDNRACAGGPS